MADGPPPLEAAKSSTAGIKLLEVKPISFSDVVKGVHHSQSTSSQPSLQQFGPSSSSADQSTNLKPVSSFQDKPCVAFSISEVKSLVDNLKFALIGKFSHGRPSMKSIRAFIANLKLSGSYNLATLDNKHVLIECSCATDFYSIWLELVWFIDGFAMKMFKWEPTYNPTKESAIAPVWIRIEGLPLHLFDEVSLRSIANSIGRPIKIDSRNLNRTMVNCARVCVELDVSKQFIDAIWISFIDDVTGIEVEGLWLQIFYDIVPNYCVSCFHIGHGVANCKRQEDLLAATSSTGLGAATKKVWLPVVRRKDVAQELNQHAPQSDQKAAEQNGNVFEASTSSGLSPVKSGQIALSQLQIDMNYNSREEEVRMDKATEVNKYKGQPISAIGGLEVHNSEQDWQTVDRKKKRGSREKDPNSKAHNPNRLVFDHSIKDLLVGPSNTKVEDQPLVVDNRQLGHVANQIITAHHSVSLEEKSDQVSSLHSLQLEGSTWLEDDSIVDALLETKAGNFEQTAGVKQQGVDQHQFDNEPTQPGNVEEPATIEAQQVRLLKPSWADQVEEENEQSTWQITAQKTTEAIGEQQDSTEVDDHQTDVTTFNTDLFTVRKKLANTPRNLLKAHFLHHPLLLRLL